MGIKEREINIKPRKADPYKSEKAFETPVTKKEAVKKFNENPNTREYGVKAVDKNLYNFLWIALIIVTILFTINIFWSNTVNSLGINKPEINITNNMPTIPVNIDDKDNQYFNNSFTIQNNNNLTVVIDMDEQLGNISEEITNEIIYKLNQSLFNLTNASL